MVIPIRVQKERGALAKLVSVQTYVRGYEIQ